MKNTSQPSLSDYCSFDHVYRQILCPFFSSLDDNRDYSQSYDLADCLKAGFSIYSLKAPSMYQFRKLAKVEEHNLGTVYGLGPIPSDNGLRKVLDGVCPEALRKGFKKLCDHFHSSGLSSRYHAWRDYTVVSVDGVEHFCSKKISCAHCLQRKHRDGSQSNYHCMLSAAIVHPDCSEVFPLAHEPIVREDGAVKNDCERNAIHRLLDYFQLVHNGVNTIFTMDALYSCAPVIRRLQQVADWRYAIGIKEDGNAYLFEQFDQLNERHKVKWMDDQDDNGDEWEIAYVNGLALNASATDLRVNMVYAIRKDAKGKETVFSYITNIKLSKRNSVKLLNIGRSRWKIENETFNTLKNQGYHFEHNFGHGKRHLCTIMAYLMMMAFWLDQLQQAANKEFVAILKDVKTRIKFWESLRAVFKLIEVESMKQLHFKIAEMYCIRLI